jgi:hypothetical protein
MLKNAAGWIMGVVGAAMAFISIAFAAVVGGAGHGWVSPFFVSLGTSIFFPISFFRLGAWRATRALGNAAMLIVGAVSVIVLVTMTLDEGLKYFRPTGGVGWMWVAIWSSWILAAILTTLLRQLGTKGPHT